MIARRAALIALLLIIIAVVYLARAGAILKPPIVTSKSTIEAAARLDPERPSSPAKPRIDDDRPIVEVVDETSRPIENAIAGTDLGEPALGRSGADGVVAWSVVALPFDRDGLLDFVIHRDPEFAAVPVRLSRTTARFRVILKRGAEVVVEVADPHRQPIPKAEIALLRRSTKDPDLTYTVAKGLTDHDGRLKVRGLASGPVFLTAVAQGFGTKVQEAFISAAENDPFRITLFPADHEIRVLVLGSDGAPASGAEVELRALGRKSSEGEVFNWASHCSHVFKMKQRTTREGRATFSVARGTLSSPAGWGAGDFDVRVTHGLLEVQRWQLALSEENFTDVTVELPARATLEVTIDRRGSSAPLHVWFEYRFRADHRGAWTAPELDLGSDESRFTVEVPSQQPGLTLHIQQFGRKIVTEKLAEFVPGETRSLTFALPQSHRLTVEVRGRKGQPVQGRLSIALQGLCPCHAKEPGYSGSRLYSGIKIPTSGDALVDVEAGAYLVRFVAGGRTLALEPITVAGDTTHPLIVDDLVTVRGRVEDVSGQPVQGATVAWFDQDRQWNHLSVSASDGRFQIAGVPDMPGAMFVMGPNGGAIRAYEGPVPAHEVRLQYSTLKVRGVIRGGAGSIVILKIYEPDPSGTSVWGHVMYLPQVSARADANGIFEAELFPGKWQVNGSHSDAGPWFRLVDVTQPAGEVQLAIP